jgi:hypothetical protein
VQDAARVLPLAGLPRSRGAAVPGAADRRRRGPDGAARRGGPQLRPLPASRRRCRLRLRRAVRAAAPQRAAPGRADRAGARQRGLAAGGPHGPQRPVGDRRGQAELRRRVPAAGVRAPRGQLGSARRALDRPQPAHPVRQLRPRRRLRHGEPRPFARAHGDLRCASVLRALLPGVRDARPRPPPRPPVRVAVRARAPRVLPDALEPPVPRGPAPAHRARLRGRRRERALHAQRPPRLRPRQPRAGPLDHRDLAAAAAGRTPLDTRRPRALPRPGTRLHGPLGRLLAPEHTGPRQHRDSTTTACR